MQLRHIRRLAVLALALALPACDGGDDGTSPDIGGDVRGSWSLLSVGGQALPVTQSYTDPEFGVCVASLTEMVASFATGGVYSETTVETVACPSQATRVDTATRSGTYTTTGNQLVVEYDDAPGELNFTYSVEGDVFTMRVGAVAYVFNRTS